MAHRGSRDIALLFQDHGTRRDWGVSVTPRPLFTPGKDPVPIVQEAGWAPASVWTGAENLAPPRFDHRTVQPVASRFTDWATQPTWLLLTVRKVSWRVISPNYRTVGNLPGFYIVFEGNAGNAVALLVEALRHNPEDRGFESQFCHWNFSLA